MRPASEGPDCPYYVAVSGGWATLAMLQCCLEEGHSGLHRARVEWRDGYSPATLAPRFTRRRHHDRRPPLHPARQLGAAVRLSDAIEAAVRACADAGLPPEAVAHLVRLWVATQLGWADA